MAEGGGGMKIDQKLVHHVADLANIELSEEEARYFEAQMSKILGYVAVLETMPDNLDAAWRPDTQGDPTPEMPDVAAASLDPEAALAAAPAKIGSAFQVPRIID